MNERFFESRQGAALVKHSVLGPYIRLFVNKLGSRYETVQYLDGYAGPGVYNDGTPGSPLLAVQVHDLVDQIRDLKATFVERDGTHANALATVLAEHSIDATVINDDLANALPDILNGCRKDPLLAFLDPFGLTITLQQLRSLLTRQAPTDVLVNVSLSALRRNAGHLTSTNKDFKYRTGTRRTILRKMDAAMGGQWWREVWKSASGTDDDRGTELAHGYATKITDGVQGFGYVILPVSDRFDGPPAFFLLLLTSHPDGVWNFNEFMSLANERLREHSIGRGEYKESLFDPTDTYVETLSRNLTRLIGTTPSFVIEQEMSAVFGDLLGFARSTHLRKAIKALSKAAVLTATDPKGKTGGVGDVQRMRIRAIT